MDCSVETNGMVKITGLAFGETENNEMIANLESKIGKVNGDV